MTDKTLKNTISLSHEEKLRELHSRVQEPDVFAVGVEQFNIHCACNHNGQMHIWREGDPEPDWKCPTLKILDGED